MQFSQLIYYIFYTMLHKKARGFFYIFLFSFAFSTKTDRFFVKLVHSSHILKAFSKDISLVKMTIIQVRQGILNKKYSLSGNIR